jgi:hypothetical protein
MPVRMQCDVMQNLALPAEIHGRRQGRRQWHGKAIDKPMAVIAPHQADRIKSGIENGI